MDDGLRKSEDTKIKLIEAAGEEFAQHGFRSATVREICRRAGTHVGAVNYHFRDKEGLYKAVLEHSHRTAMQKYPVDLGVSDGASPEERLRAFIHSFLLRMLAEGFPAWHGKLMAHEISNPSGILEQMVQSSIRPLHAYLVGILRELLNETGAADGEENERMFLCTTSIVGQCLHYYMGRHFISILHPKSFEPANIERLTDHITRFSLGGIQGLKAAD